MSAPVSDRWAADGRPKRILALDGGGVRGILSLGVLERIEAVLRERHGRSDIVLADYFDLIAGTSTGAIIAAGLARGMTVESLVELYRDLAGRIFERSFFRRGLFRAKYGVEALTKEFITAFGQTTTLASPSLKTGLLVMLKRLDTGSPWPVSNNPAGRYFAGGDEVVPNADYPLWQVVRASTAAPSYFEPEDMEIHSALSGRTAKKGLFVDGGVSPHNNPALQAFMYATLSGYRVGWPASADQLLVTSVGTGRAVPAKKAAALAGAHAIHSLLSVLDDSADLVETMMQWLSSSPTARSIDRELGSLEGDLLGGRAQCTYLRYDALFDVGGLDNELGLTVAPEVVGELSEMDDPSRVDLLLDIGRAVGERKVDAHHFPAGFDRSLG